jgi:hypothetical protein
MQWNHFKKTRNTISIAIFFILLLPYFFISPKTADAIVIPVIDGAANAQLAILNTQQAASNAGQALFNASIWSKEYVLDLVAYTAANVALNLLATQLQNKILNATNSFVQDLRQELVDLENDVGGKLGVDINAVNTCFPNLDLSPDPLPAWNKPKFQASITCSRGTPAEFTTFYDSKKFNWDTYNKMAFNPEKYNPFGTKIAIEKELVKRTEKTKKQELEQLKWGRGLRGVKDSLTGLIKTPAAAVQKQLDEAFSTSLRRSENADELTEILAAFISSIVSNSLQGTFQ